MEISAADEIIESLQNEENHANFHSASDEKCVKMELFPANDFRQESRVHLSDSGCINAVLEVNYKFFWRENEITKIHANILLGKIEIEHLANFLRLRIYPKSSIHSRKY